MDQDWVAVFHPDHTPFVQDANSPMRGAWFLYASPSEFYGVWDQVRDLTEEGELGYRTSYLQNLHESGRYLICVFGVLQEILDIKETLEDCGFGEYIEEFRLSKEFRYTPMGKLITDAINQEVFGS